MFNFDNYKTNGKYDEQKVLNTDAKSQSILLINFFENYGVVGEYAELLWKLNDSLELKGYLHPRDINFNSGVCGHNGKTTIAPFPSYDGVRYKKTTQI